MSMSQEEIEALMNGLDIVDDDASSSTEEELSKPEESLSVNTEEIEELISQNEEVSSSEDVEDNVQEEISKNLEEESSNEIVNNDDLDSLIKGFEEETASEEIVDEEVNSIDDIDIEPIVNNDITTESFDDISADEEGIVESTSKAIESQAEENNSHDNDEIGKVWADSKINEGIFPLPADSDKKVVNQLSQVANDSEEKVSQIFDVLSLALDNNNDIRTKVESFDKYINSELELLNSLSTKFPNIEVFNTQKELSNQMKNDINEISNIVNAEDMKIFEAMELMQFNDINRQKIERVMSVIRKLSSYLNNLFEDNGSSQEIAVAKHIHGDKDHDLIGEDLDKLINEFKK